MPRRGKCSSSRNAQRVDLAPLDEAEAYTTLLESGMTIRDLAKTLSRKPSRDRPPVLRSIHLPAGREGPRSRRDCFPVAHAELIGPHPR